MRAIRNAAASHLRVDIHIAVVRILRLLKKHMDAVQAEEEEEANKRPNKKYGVTYEEVVARFQSAARAAHKRFAGTAYGACSPDLFEEKVASSTGGDLLRRRRAPNPRMLQEDVQEVQEALLQGPKSPQEDVASTTTTTMTTTTTTTTTTAHI